ncbi:MAG: hypothetical protein M5R42_04380 [Rhodocyclaceae bacterium]|nr:hypothetical protein [Rhodocyclaceae bacterium]
MLLVIDSLGYDYLLRHGAGGTLHRHLHSRLTSVFPSTTASAVTAYLSGLRAPQHALTGWHMCYELHSIAAVLPARGRAAQDCSMRCPAPCRSSCSAMRPSSTASRAAPPSSHRNPSPARTSISTTPAAPQCAATRP